jgi:hypothetical protein
MLVHKAAHVPFDGRRKSGKFQRYLTTFRGRYFLQLSLEYRKTSFYNVFHTLTHFDSVISHFNYHRVISHNIRRTLSASSQFHCLHNVVKQSVIGHDRHVLSEVEKWTPMAPFTAQKQLLTTNKDNYLVWFVSVNL